MSYKSSHFINKLESHIKDNLNNEQFGVEQLASEMGMSRSNLHRKLQKETGKSISQYIREFRLEEALGLLRESDMNASEVADAVGFGSASYFSKCFLTHFGYSPSRAKFEAVKVPENTSDVKPSTKPKLLWMGIGALAIMIGFLIFSSKTREESISGEPERGKSIIVLPFKNLSPNQENQYLADGMVEAISRRLSIIDSLEVINSEASGPLTSIRKIGEILNVSTVLKGSVQKHDSMIRVEVKLLDASDESQIWADNYDRKAGDILKINSDIARKVAQALQVTLTPNENTLIKKQSPYDPVAYDYALQGIYHFEQLTPEGRVESLRLFNKALEIDSTLALAYHGLAGIYLWKASFESEPGPKEATAKAKFFINKARHYDPKFWGSVGQEAYISLHMDWDFEKAEELFLSCIRKGMPIYDAIYINFLLQENRYKDAYEQCIEFTKKNPFYHNSPVPSVSFYVNNYEWGNDFIESRTNTNTISLFNLGRFGHFYLGFEEYDKAIFWFKKREEIYGVRSPMTLGYLGAAYAKKGDIQKALTFRDELAQIKSVTNAGSPAWGIAIIHAALGQNDKALEWIERAVDDSEHEILWLVSEPQFFSLHSTPRFSALVKKVGFREHAYPIKKLPMENVIPKMRRD